MPGLVSGEFSMAWGRPQGGSGRPLHRQQPNSAPRSGCHCTSLVPWIRDQSSTVSGNEDGGKIGVARDRYGMQGICHARDMCKKNRMYLYKNCEASDCGFEGLKNVIFCKFNYSWKAPFAQVSPVFQLLKSFFRSDPPCDSNCDSVCDSICDSNCDSNCDSICDSICDSNFGSDQLHDMIRFSMRNSLDLCMDA